MEEVVRAFSDTTLALVAVYSGEEEGRRKAACGVRRSGPRILDPVVEQPRMEQAAKGGQEVVLADPGGYWQGALSMETGGGKEER